VELHSLVASADLNGLSGTIDGYDIDTQRYTVKLDGGKGDRRIKESNLKKASIFSGIASSQAPPPTPAPRWEPPPPTTQPRSGAAGGGTGSSRRTRLVQRTVNSLNDANAAFMNTGPNGPSWLFAPGPAPLAPCLWSRASGLTIRRRCPPIRPFPGDEVCVLIVPRNSACCFNSFVQVSVPSFVVTRAAISVAE